MTEREHLLMEAAQCIWEHILDQLVETDRLRPNPWWETQRENLGTSALRHWARELAPIALQAYDVALEGREELGEAYDLEFIPWFVENSVAQKDITYELKPVMKPDWKPKLQYHYWTKDLEEYLACRYGLDRDDVAVNGNSLWERFIRGDDWREIVGHAAEKYGWEELPTFKPARFVGHAK